MTLLQMNYILEIDRCGSMNKAAQNLFVSQSALSNAIGEVEKELGILIFHRSNRGIVLTEEGRELVMQISPIIERCRKINRYYGERKAENRVKLSIAAQRYPFCVKAFVEFLHLLEEPRIEVSLKEMEMSQVIEQVADRQSDLGIIFVSDMTEHFIRRMLDNKNLEFFQMVKITPHVFMRREHPLAQEESVTLEQLQQYPYVVFTQSDSNLNYAEEVVVGTAADFDQVVYVSDRATIYSIMAHTNAVSTGSGVLPEGYGDERLIAVPLRDQHDMRLGYIKPRNQELSEKGVEFVAILQKIMSEIGEKI